MKRLRCGRGLLLRKNQEYQESCTAFNSPCNESCECCGYEAGTARCEQRNKPLGYRCYKSIGLGGQCDHDKDCRSQKCTGGICIPHFMRGPKVPTCSLAKDAISVISKIIHATMLCQICHQ